MLRIVGYGPRYHDPAAGRQREERRKERRRQGHGDDEPLIEAEFLGTSAAAPEDQQRQYRRYQPIEEVFPGVAEIFPSDAPSPRLVQVGAFEGVGARLV